jgi:hypothetical protein
MYILSCIICRSGKSLILITSYSIHLPVFFLCYSEMSPPYHRVALHTSTPCQVVPRSPHTSLPSTFTPPPPCRGITSLPSIGPTSPLPVVSSCRPPRSVDRSSSRPYRRHHRPDLRAPLGRNFSGKIVQRPGKSQQPHPLHQPSCTLPSPPSHQPIQPLPG